MRSLPRSEDLNCIIIQQLTHWRQLEKNKSITKDIRNWGKVYSKSSAKKFNEKFIKMAESATTLQNNQIKTCENRMQESVCVHHCLEIKTLHLRFVWNILFSALLNAILIKLGTAFVRFLKFEGMR